MQQFGHQRPMAVVHHAVGMGTGYLLEQVLGSGRDPNTDHAIAAAHDALFATWRYRIHPFPDSRLLLNWCRDAGLTVALATSGGQRDLGPMLDVLDQPDFDVVVTGDDVANSKPSTDLLAMVLQRTGLRARNMLVVGDSVWDMQAAGRVGAPAIGIATGGTRTPPELREAGAALTFASLAPLLGDLQKNCRTAYRPLGETTRPPWVTPTGRVSSLGNDGAGSAAPWSSARAGCPC